MTQMVLKYANQT